MEQFQEAFDPNAAATPPPRSRLVSSAAFSVDNDDTAAKKPVEDVAPRRPDASQFSSAPPKQPTNSIASSRTLATASRDELVALFQRQAAKINQSINQKSKKKSNFKRGWMKAIKKIRFCGRRGTL